MQFASSEGAAFCWQFCGAGFYRAVRGLCSSLSFCSSPCWGVQDEDEKAVAGCPALQAAVLGVPQMFSLHGMYAVEKMIYNAF